MTEVNLEIQEQGEVMENMEKFCEQILMDNFYMIKFFDVEFIQYVLWIIMRDNELMVKEVRTQKYLKGSKRDVVLDVCAVGVNGSVAMPK